MTKKRASELYEEGIDLIEKIKRCSNPKVYKALLSRLGQINKELDNLLNKQKMKFLKAERNEAILVVNIFIPIVVFFLLLEFGKAVALRQYLGIIFYPLYLLIILCVFGFIYSQKIKRYYIALEMEVEEAL